MMVNLMDVIVSYIFAIVIFAMIYFVLKMKLDDEKMNKEHYKTRLELKQKREKKECFEKYLVKKYGLVKDENYKDASKPFYFGEYHD